MIERRRREHHADVEVRPPAIDRPPRQTLQPVSRPRPKQVERQDVVPPACPVEFNRLGHGTSLAQSPVRDVFSRFAGRALHWPC